MNKFNLFFCLSILLFSCGNAEKAQLRLELYTADNEVIENINSIYLTNKPELMDGGQLFFWDKWGLQTYEFENIKKTESNEFLFELIEPGEYTFFFLVKSDSILKSAELRDLNLVPGLNSFKKEISLNTAIRRYMNE